MAELVPTYRRQTVFGDMRAVLATLPAAADADTWKPGIKRIKQVMVSYNDPDAAAADSVAATHSGDTVTFEVAGTARDVNVLVLGW